MDNAYSILDKTDLVMIDPVGTGLSKAVGDAKDKDFWGSDPDIDSIAHFIRQYVSDNGRWNSPKYMLGESYGTTRAPGIIDRLEGKGMAFNGVILVSVAMDLGALFDYSGNDRPYPLILPSYAAVSAYHKVLPTPPQNLDAFLNEVRQYAAGEYASALLAGDALPAARRAAVVKKLHEYTGLSEDYIEKANLRLGEGLYSQELLRQKGATVGRLDARFIGPTLDILAKEADYDPQASAISAAYIAAFLAYYNEELKFGQGKTYMTTNYDVGRAWDFKHKVPGAEFPAADDRRGPRSRARDDPEPEPARPGAERDVRPRDPDLRDGDPDERRPHPGEPARPHRDEVLPGGAHDVRLRAVVEGVQGGHRGVHRPDVETLRDLPT